MPSTRAVLVVLALLPIACVRPDVQADAGGPELAVERIAEGSGTRLLVVAPDGVKLSAAVKPVLRLENGDTVQFDTTAVSEDSLYYTAPPAAWVQTPPAGIRGVLHAGICDEVTSTCRRVTVEI